ncbi:MAG TPA: hypothetical protein VNI01_05260 [Elusimicrobiota bacterium]|jgi:hypothetical protein|nr:hypothetical protein [Elusimicrobiota bacterium]
MSRRSERGSAFLLAMVFIVIALTSITLLHRRIRTLLASVQSESAIDDAQELRLLALSEALTLLESGSPSAEEYGCRLSVRRSGQSTTFAVDYKTDGDNWSVSVSSTDVAGGLPACPGTFGS